MCGIAGCISGQIPENFEEIASRMAYQLLHRGPDGQSYYMDNNALLVHTRLSIIDLKGGRQPIHNEDKTIWIVFNGEIFNYIELRKLLEYKGHKFYTRSDTEVIVHLYEEYGNEFVSHLNGQFAICLWDAKNCITVLARDRAGICPLYYSVDSGELWFASELKALIAGQQKMPEIDYAGLRQILHFWSTVSPSTLFRGILEVSPGEIVIYSRNKIQKKLYWDLKFPPINEYEDISESDAVKKIHDLLVDATKIRLRADVPVGAYLSGGLDSSILTSVIHQFLPSNLRTFSLTFEDTDLDEASYQQQLARHLNTQHSSIECSNTDIAESFESTIWNTESPVIRTAPIPMGLLSRHVHDSNLKVVLTGEGADEIFGGYDIFKEAKLRYFWSINPNSTWRPLLVKRLYPYLKLPSGNAISFLASFFGGGIDNPEYPLFSHLTRIDTTGKIEQFLSAEILNHTEEIPETALINKLPPDFDRWSYFSKAQYIEFKTLTAGYLLSSQGDRMLMKSSVEGRFPFLDHRLIEFANRLKPNLKMKVLNEKYILKKAMGRYIPDVILRRYKQPYRAPMILSFFEKRNYPFVSQLMDPNLINDYGIFDSKKTELLRRKVRSGRALSYKDNTAFIFILSTQSWCNQFIINYREQFCRRRNLALERVQ